jgi:hypothetical protein
MIAAIFWALILLAVIIATGVVAIVDRLERLIVALTEKEPRA